MQPQQWEVRFASAGGELDVGFAYQMFLPARSVDMDALLAKLNTALQSLAGTLDKRMDLSRRWIGGTTQLTKDQAIQRGKTKTKTTFAKIRPRPTISACRWYKQC
jgi:hypothetical protein